MPGLDPGIHVDHRVKPGDDGEIGSWLATVGDQRGRGGSWNSQVWPSGSLMKSCDPPIRPVTSS